MEARIRDLAATYEVEYDDDPPLVNAMSLGQRITIGLSDAKSGISTFKGYVDGQFVLFEEVAKSPWVSCDLTKTPVKRTGKMQTEVRSHATICRTSAFTKRNSTIDTVAMTKAIHVDNNLYINITIKNQTY